MPTHDGSADALIRRRHVLYVEGYDPQGAEGYHNLFSRSFKRFLKNWPLTTAIGELQIDSDDLAHWTVDAAGPTLVIRNVGSKAWPTGTVVGENTNASARSVPGSLSVMVTGRLGTEAAL